MMIALAVIIWEAIDASGNLKQIAEWWADVKPHLLPVWRTMVSIDGTWYRVGLFVFGIGWVVYAGRRSEVTRQESPSIAPAPSQQAVTTTGHPPRADEAVERPLFLMGFCWKIQPRFFEIYRRSHFPEAATLEECVLGPLCVKCGRLRAERRVLKDGPIDLIEQECPTGGCGDRVSSAQLVALPAGLVIYKARSEVYREAQRLVFAGLDFPSCPTLTDQSDLGSDAVVEPLKALGVRLRETLEGASGLDYKLIPLENIELSTEYSRLILRPLEALIRQARQVLAIADPATRQEIEDWDRFANRYWRIRRGEQYTVINPDGTPQVWPLKKLDEELTDPQRERLFTLHPDLRQFYG